MLLPAMIFAGVTLIVGFLLGYLLGAARSRMAAEQQMGEAEATRAALESQFKELRGQLEALRAPAAPPSAPSPPSSR